MLRTQNKQIYDLWYACVVSALLRNMMSVSVNQTKPFSFPCFFFFFLYDAFHISALSLGSRIFPFQAPTWLATSAAEFPLEGMHQSAMK